MLILGWHGSWEDNIARSDRFHDSAAVLLRDGKAVAAVEEERLDRVKHSHAFPCRAIRFCLDQARVSLCDLDAIAVDMSEQGVNSWLLYAALGDPGRPRMSGREWLASLFAREFGVDVSHKLRFCRHHLAHLYSTWYSSGLRDGLAVCIDGFGEQCSGLIALCSGDDIKVLRYLPMAESLGAFYVTAISILGYRQFDEYKVMGLAPYGDPNVYAGTFEKLYQLRQDGGVTFRSHDESYSILEQAGLTVPLRRGGEPFTQQHKDFAAALQISLERMVEHVLGHYQRLTGARNLCLSGGVAQNCSMNGKILRSGLFESVYVSPVAHDAGNALGAALQIMWEEKRSIPPDVMRHVYLGTDIGASAAILERLENWRPLVEFRQAPDPATTAAELIAGGKVIAWVQGRSEFGPRALGNRSILADPRPAQNKQIINAMIKKRESYRPFAPSVLQERMREYFEVPEQTSAAPFMTFVLPVQPRMRTLLGAITHVDGTARVQSVSCEDNPLYYRLIVKFAGLTGVAVVLNTSFNNNAEPIVESVDDAVTCFLTTGIHALIIGDWVLTKAAELPVGAAVRGLVPSIPRHLTLVHRVNESGEPACSIAKTVDTHLWGASTPISRTLYDLLLDDSERASILARCRHLGLRDGLARGPVEMEVFDLWQRRLIRLEPPSWR